MLILRPPSAFAWLMVFALILSSCSSLTNQNQAGSDASTEKDIEAVTQWSARGKFSYTSGETREQGNFAWQQNGNDYKLRLFGPLGIGSIRISGNDNLVRIQNRDQDISSDQPLSLLYRITGLQIPLTSMHQWLLAKPASLSPEDIIKDSQGRVLSLSERDWKLNYGLFKDFDGYSAPTQINAYKDDIHLRMRITVWQSNEP